MDDLDKKLLAAMVSPAQRAIAESIEALAERDDNVVSISYGKSSAFSKEIPGSGLILCAKLGLEKPFDHNDDIFNYLRGHNLNANRSISSSGQPNRYSVLVQDMNFVIYFHPAKSYT